MLTKTIAGNARSERDPFTGTWVYQPEKSQSTGPQLERWVQWIEAGENEVRVREEVVVATGQRASVSLQAKFDGQEYPVVGSSLSETTAYTRNGLHNITGTGRKNGSVTLRETICVAEDGETLTLSFKIFVQEREVMHGVGVFERQKI